MEVSSLQPPGSQIWASGPWQTHVSGSNPGKLQVQVHLQLHLPMVLPVLSAHSQLGDSLDLLITLLSTLASPPAQCLCFGADACHFCDVPWEHSPAGSLCLLFWPVSVQHSISKGLCFKMFYPHFRKLLWILIACTQCTPQTWRYLRIHRESLWLAYINYV